MKKVINYWLLIIGYLVIFLYPIPYTLYPVSAHVLESSGSVGAVLHIDPEDDPIAGQQASFFFEFKDKQGKFKPANCDCTFKILEGDKEIFSQPLFQNNTDPSLTNASIFYTFPQKDVYEVKVTGKPNVADAFQPFTLEYDVRVAKEATNQPAPTSTSSGRWISTHIPHLIGAFLVLAFLIFALIKQRDKAQT